MAGSRTATGSGEFMDPFSGLSRCAKAYARFDMAAKTDGTMPLVVNIWGTGCRGRARGFTGSVNVDTDEFLCHFTGNDLVRLFSTLRHVGALKKARTHHLLHLALFPWEAWRQEEHRRPQKAVESVNSIS